jgi:uncharacterized protein YceK
VKFAVLGFICALALQGCSSSSSHAPSTSSSEAASSNAAKERREATELATGGGCQQLFGRPSPFGSCRDS